MLNLLIEKSYQEIERLDCCHEDGRKCCCKDCLYKDFREGPDDYNCPKKLNYYVARYASSFTSEIYNYLAQSRIIDQFENRVLRVLSLGCGFGPDYYAISHYIELNNLDIVFEYKGLDCSPHWDAARIEFPNLHFETFNLTNQFRIDGYDVVFLNKVFSTIHKHNQHDIFLNNLKISIDLTRDEALILVFNDVNSIHMGREIFDSQISPKFQNVTKYYIGNDPQYTERTWQRLQNEMIFPLKENDLVNQLTEFRKFIYFEYRK